jgi:hypothetical protein
MLGLRRPGYELPSEAVSDDGRLMSEISSFESVRP